MISRNFVVFTFLLMLSACVSIDSRSWKEIVDVDTAKSISGVYSNEASYISTGVFAEAKNFAEFMGSGTARESKYVTVVLDDVGLTLRFSDSEEVISHTFEDGLKIGNDGKIIFSSGRDCEREGVTIVCYGGTVKMFVNVNGDLVTTISGGGGGFFSILPLGLYFKHIAIFPPFNE